jgi:hypothetical protein
MGCRNMGLDRIYTEPNAVITTTPTGGGTVLNQTEMTYDDFNQLTTSSVNTEALWAVHRPIRKTDMTRVPQAPARSVHPR